MRKLKFFTIVVLLLLVQTIQTKAQEIEVTDSEVFIRAEAYGVLKFYSDGGLLLNNTNTSSTPFTINGTSSSQEMLAIRTNWASPASLAVYGDGTAYLHAVAVTSDSTLKKDIVNLGSQIDNIKRLRGVSYNWKKKGVKGDKQTYGLIAQDLEKVYPDMVFTNDSGVKAIYYNELIPVLLEVQQEQQALIESLQSEVEKLKKQVGANLKSASTLIGSTDNALYQNYPNPFNESTKIEYQLADDFQKAMINIYDMNGTQLKSIELHLSGHGNITVDGGEFKAGMYMYTLIADGKVVDTKRMVLTD